ESVVSRGGGQVRRPAGIGGAGNDRFVVVWQASGNALDDSGSGIFGRVFALDGTPLRHEFQISQTRAGDQADPSLAWITGDAFVVGWSGNGTGDDQGVFT